MKKLLVFLLCLFSGSIFADITIVQKVDNSGVLGEEPQKGNVTIYIKGSKIRIDQVDQVTSRIINIDTGKMYVLSSDTKTVSPMNANDLKLYQGLFGYEKGTPSLEKTGNTKTVNGYACEEYKFKTDGTPSTETVAWVSNQIKTDEIEKFRKFSEDLPKQFGALPSEVKGFPVVSDTKITSLGDTMSRHAELVSVSYDPVSDSVFEIPSDYDEL
jgi:hypothetical protein